MGSLSSENRELGFSKGQMNKFRKQGRIPAVVFGKNRDQSWPIFVNWVAFQKCLSSEGKVFQLEVNGNVELVNAKVVDLTPMGQPQHISFHQLVRGEASVFKVPVNLVGESVGEKAGGVIQAVESQISVKGMPKNIPENVELDISSLEIGQNLTAGDLKLPTGLELAQEADLNLVVCQAPKQEEAEEEVALAPEGEALEAPVAEASAEDPAEEKK